MMDVREWIGRWFGGEEPSPNHPPAWTPGPGRPRPHTILYWALTAWTGLCALALLFSRGSVARALAGGLGDQAGRHLLGAQALLLAIVFGAIALRPGRLEWLPLLSQWLIVVVLAYDWLAGRRAFGGVALALLIALAFALLLTGFRLAGESTVHARPPVGAPPRGPDGLPYGETPTERLSPGPEMPAAPSAAGQPSPTRTPDDHPDDHNPGA